ncbi:anthranilate synthase component I family protein [Anaerobiospirillum sp. NML120448]|uniref:anthranilate synthase component I family protein n=1 Tax=Anaerobiospirillum sp. NML120448 TaxID=2932816 RepID=UPI001FF65295|nr:anthranilate synthase component I family protein [Anaerobiospirillum sp. NML120448]MCK0515096.1 anthranilate synthase component I family protein [Anaerobiospirillum sp. NML120448]
MKFVPTLEEVNQLAQEEKFHIVPISCEILSDLCTPIQALNYFKHAGEVCFLLESVAAHERWGRYTFLGWQPSLEITCREGVMKVGAKQISTSDPNKHIRELLKDYKAPRFHFLPSFTGGLVGYFAYDYLTYAEPTAKVNHQVKEHFNDIDLMLFDKVIAFDHLKQKIVLIVNIKLSKDGKEQAKLYEQAITKLKEISEGLHKVAQVPLSKVSKETKEQSPLLDKIEFLFSKEQYCSMVEKAQRYIHEGDIFQIVLSNKVSVPFDGSLLNTYRILRTTNPSPYMFFFSSNKIEVAGASPETLVKLQDGIVHTFPLAGTRPRGHNEQEDERLAFELLHDEKELAEHNMLVDLGRNDLGKICSFGSVQVTKLHSIERYSHVMHMGSTVRGEIAPHCDALDAIAAVLPAGTLSGAPKIRACQLIGQLEGVERGIYGGAFGYIDFTGNMDMCIAIRLAYLLDGKVHVRSGAGIVADSIGQNEYQECINKAKAVINALTMAQDNEEL